MLGPCLGQCSDLRRRRVALELLLASHSTLTELEQREVELLLQSQAWDEPPLGAELLGRPTTRLDPATTRAARAAQQATAQQATAHGPHFAWNDGPPGHSHSHSHSRSQHTHSHHSHSHIHIHSRSRG